LYSVFYHCPFSPSCNISVVLTSGPFLPSGRDSIFRANTPLLYFDFYYCPFSSGRDPLAVLVSCSLSRVASIFLFLVTNLSLWAAPYYSLALQLLLATITVPAVCIYPASAKRLK
jgi:hypothetical protein